MKEKAILAIAGASAIAVTAAITRKIIKKEKALRDMEIRTSAMFDKITRELEKESAVCE